MWYVSFCQDIPVENGFKESLYNHWTEMFSEDLQLFQRLLSNNICLSFSFLFTAVAYKPGLAAKKTPNSWVVLSQHNIDHVGQTLITGHCYLYVNHVLYIYSTIMHVHLSFIFLRTLCTSFCCLIFCCEGDCGAVKQQKHSYCLLISHG